MKKNRETFIRSVNRMSPFSTGPEPNLIPILQIVGILASVAVFLLGIRAGGNIVGNPHAVEDFVKEKFRIDLDLIFPKNRKRK